MLSLLWTRLGRRFTFWSKLVLFSSVLHLLGLFLVLFVYSGQKSTYHVNINRSILKSGAPIIFMNRRRVMQRKSTSRAKTGPRISVVKKPSVKPKKTQNLKTKIIKKRAKPKKPAAKTKVLKKKPEKKQVKKTKKIEKQKAKPKKLVKKQVKPEKKRVSKKPEKKQAKPEKKVLKAPLVVPTQSTHTVYTGEQKQAHVQDAIYIGQQELEALKIQYEIEAEVKKHWRPPAGLSKDLSCTVNVLVDWNRKATKVQVAQSSGVLIYDVSARMAVSRLCLPSVLKGKEVHITFNQ
ncbi:TonB C-terminal domain-containing protein [Candidatus Dependentiae bacterium]